MKLERLKGRGHEYLYRHPIYKTIYFRRFTLETGEVTKSLRTTEVGVAKDRRDQILRGTQVVVKHRLMALELFDKWIERKRSLNLAPATITSVRNSRRSFEPFLATMLPQDITAEWWESEYVPRARQMYKASRKFFNDTKWIKSFLKQLHEDGVIQKLPKIKNPDKKKSIGRVLSDEEVGTLLNFAQNEDLYLAILMAATMGMRRGEIFSLRTSDIDQSDWSIRLLAEQTKTRKERSFAISKATLPILKVRVQSGSPWVFPSKANPDKPLHKDGYMTAWRNLKRTTGIEGRFHDLRHTFLTKAFGAPGANPALICHYAGLSLEVAERVYLHLSKEDSRKVAGLVSYEV